MGNESRYKALRGMSDILPEEAANIRKIEDKAREVFRRFGYGEIRTPLLEETEVFTRSIGSDTDIVEKEMYSFKDRGGKEISLRPEGTASIIRAYIEHGWNNTADLVKVFYSGPMFRGERPQKGRLRQFHQIGAEIIGGSDPFIDAELILNLDFLLREFGVKDFTILINSLGCSKDRTNYKKVLSEYLKGKSDKLCEDCNRRVSSNVLRVLDCKRPECKAVVEEAPCIVDHLCGKCNEDYNVLKQILTESGVSFLEKKNLVRGLDYYTGSIFEVICSSLGAQDAIAAGGRYDGLSSEMGGPDAGATGYAIGIERLLLVLGDSLSGKTDIEGVFVVCMGPDIKKNAFNALKMLRENGITSDMDFSDKSFKAQLRKANRNGWKYVIIMGEDEVKENKFLIKEMETGDQKFLPQEEAVKYLQKVTGVC